MNKKLLHFHTLAEQIQIQGHSYLVLHNDGLQTGLNESIFNKRTFSGMIFGAVEENDKAMANSNQQIFGFGITYSMKHASDQNLTKTRYLNPEEFRKQISLLPSNAIPYIREITIFFDNASFITIYTLSHCTGHSHLDFSVDGVESSVDHNLGKNWKRVFYKDYNGE